MILETAGKTGPRLFKAGAGKSVITPPAGFAIYGPEHETSISTGVLDDLLARVIVIESNGIRIIVISLDIWGMSSQLLNFIKGAASAAGGVSVDSIWLTITGNGTSPPLWKDEGEYSNYVSYLPEQIAGAVSVAVESMEPASMGSTGTLLPDISTFIEGPGRPGNPALFVLAVNRSDGSGIARLVNFSCPGTVIGPVDKWTADYPGYVSWALEQGGGGVSLFSQGPSHDIRPYDWWEGNDHVTHADRTASDVQAIGLLVATQAAAGAAETTQRRNVEIGVSTDRVAGLHVVKIGDAFLVSTEKPQPNKFARRIRRDLPHSNIIIAANSSGGTFDAKFTFDARAVRRGISLLRDLGAS